MDNLNFDRLLSSDSQSSWSIRLVMLTVGPRVYVLVTNRNQHGIESNQKLNILQLLTEFDRLSISIYYETIEISALGHYQPASIGTTLIQIFQPYHNYPQIYCKEMFR